MVIKKVALLAALVMLLGAATAAQQITVGKNHHVSGDEPEASHTELLAAADPNNPRRLVGVAIVISARHNKLYSVLYASRDGGRTWRQTLNIRDAWALSADPACAFGPDGTAYFSVMGYKPPGEGAPDGRGDILLSLYRSKDGGLSWAGPTLLTKSGVSDREYVAVDQGPGPRRGWVYVAGQTPGKNLDGASTGLQMTLFRSRDGGATFDVPARLGRGKETATYHPGNNVVLSDGTVLSSVTEFRPPAGVQWENNRVKYERGEPNAQIKVFASRDGGDTLEGAATVSDASIPFSNSSLSTIPSLAADTHSPHFKDRAYVAWADSVSGRSEIYLSYSGDKGRTWSKPARVNDDRPRLPPGEGPDNHLPAVAVNREGVVGVMWYDRRESPDNSGWTVRFAASLDGGETFGPSVRVSEGEMSHERDRINLTGAATRARPGGPLTLILRTPGFNLHGGHTSALVAAADGVFHPLWVDNRTGVMQAWTASVSVAGRVVRNGSPELAGLADITERVRIDFDNITYDRAAGQASISARIKNTSREELRGPIKIRAVSIGSTLAGEVKIADADNRETGSGAVWDFTPQLTANRLGPGEHSAPKRLSFRLTHPLPFRQSGRLMYTAVSLDVRVLGADAGSAPGSGKTAEPRRLSIE